MCEYSGLKTHFFTELEESSVFPSSGFLKPTNPSTPPFSKLPTILETFAPTDFSFDAPSRIGENRSNFEQIPINFGASTSFGSASTSSNFPRNEGFGNQLNPKTPIDFVPPPNYNTNYQFPGASTLNDNAASTSMPGNSKYNQDNNPMVIAIEHSSQQYNEYLSFRTWRPIAYLTCQCKISAFMAM